MYFHRLEVQVGLNININIVECKYVLQLLHSEYQEHININIVECKWNIYWFMRTGG